MNASTSPEHRCPHAEQAVGLALHALEPADEELLVQHIPRCAECQEMTRMTQDVVWGLAADAEQHEPPARLYDDLMAAVAATDQVPPEQREPVWTPQPGATPAPARSGRTAAGPPPPAAAAPADPARRARRRLRGRAAHRRIAVFGIGAVSYETLVRSRQLNETGLAAPSPEVARLLAEADRAGARHAVLHGTDGTVVAAVAQYPDMARQVMPIQLLANRADRTVYVLWGTDGGTPKALGWFDVIASSETMLPVREPVPTGEFTSYAISIESGRAMPPSPSWVVARGKVQS